MKTAKQEELINAFLQKLDDDAASVYSEIIRPLSALGYFPRKEKSGISFKHDLHNKQIAKMSLKTSKKSGASPSFALRFSACQGYSQRFSDIVCAYMAKYPTRRARCIIGECSYCRGDAAGHVYTDVFSDDTANAHCGAYAIEILNVSAVDINEINNLIEEEHSYLLKHEAGI